MISRVGVEANLLLPRVGGGDGGWFRVTHTYFGMGGHRFVGWD